jgi:hypothetical protein
VLKVLSQVHREPQDSKVLKELKEPKVQIRELREIQVSKEPKGLQEMQVLP